MYNNNFPREKAMTTSSSNPLGLTFVPSTILLTELVTDFFQWIHGFIISPRGTTVFHEIIWGLNQGSGF